jgi:hypothetical protein
MKPSSDVCLHTNGPRDAVKVVVADPKRNLWVATGPMDLVVATREMDHGKIPGARPHLHTEMDPCVDRRGNE